MAITSSCRITINDKIYEDTDSINIKSLVSLTANQSAISLEELDITYTWYIVDSTNASSVRLLPIQDEDKSNFVSVGANFDNYTNIILKCVINNLSDVVNNIEIITNNNISLSDHANNNILSDITNIPESNALTLYSNIITIHKSDQKTILSTEKTLTLDYDNAVLINSQDLSYIDDSSSSSALFFGFGTTKYIKKRISSSNGTFDMWEPNSRGTETGFPFPCGIEDQVITRNFEPTQYRLGVVDIYRIVDAKKQTVWSSCQNTAQKVLSGGEPYSCEDIHDIVSRPDCTNTVPLIYVEPCLRVTPPKQQEIVYCEGDRPDTPSSFNPNNLLLSNGVQITHDYDPQYTEHTDQYNRSFYLPVLTDLGLFPITSCKCNPKACKGDIQRTAARITAQAVASGTGGAVAIISVIVSGTVQLLSKTPIPAALGGPTIGGIVLAVGLLYLFITFIALPFGDVILDTFWPSANWHRCRKRIYKDVWSITRTSYYGFPTNPYSTLEQFSYPSQLETLAFTPVYEPADSQDTGSSITIAQDSTTCQYYVASVTGRPGRTIKFKLSDSSKKELIDKKITHNLAPSISVLLDNNLDQCDIDQLAKEKGIFYVDSDTFGQICITENNCQASLSNPSLSCDWVFYYGPPTTHTISCAGDTNVAGINFTKCNRPTIPGKTFTLQMYNIIAGQRKRGDNDSDNVFSNLSDAIASIKSKSQDQLFAYTYPKADPKTAKEITIVDGCLKINGQSKRGEKRGPRYNIVTVLSNDKLQKPCDICTCSSDIDCGTSCEVCDPVYGCIDQTHPEHPGKKIEEIRKYGGECCVTIRTPDKNSQNKPTKTLRYAKKSSCETCRQNKEGDYVPTDVCPELDPLYDYGLRRWKCCKGAGRCYDECEKCEDGVIIPCLFPKACIEDDELTTVTKPLPPMNEWPDPFTPPAPETAVYYAKECKIPPCPKCQIPADDYDSTGNCVDAADVSLCETCVDDPTPEDPDNWKVVTCDDDPTQQCCGGECIPKSRQCCGGTACADNISACCGDACWDKSGCDKCEDETIVPYDPGPCFNCDNTPKCSDTQICCTFNNVFVGCGDKDCDSCDGANGPKCTATSNPDCPCYDPSSIQSIFFVP